jgi:hypothetical protein
MPEGYLSLEEKPYESHYLLVEALVGYPIEKVWPQALQIGKWMSGYRMETIHGRAGEIGHFEKVYSNAAAPGCPTPHHHYYGVAEIIPYKCIVLEVIPERGGSYGINRPRMSFDNIMFADLKERTNVQFLHIDVLMGHATQDKDLERRRGLLARRLEGYFENLRRLVAENC